MISLTFNVANVATVLHIYDRIQVRRFNGTPPPTIPVEIGSYVTISGTDSISSRTNVSDILLKSNFTTYYYYDSEGEEDDWYTSRYYNESNGTTSGWSDPIVGEAGEIYYDPVYPSEVEYGTSEQLIIDRIRLYIGDPIGLRREYGEEAMASIHEDGKTFEFSEFGWPASINMGGVQYNSTDNPSVNGYKFLRFNDYIDDVCTDCVTYSGCGTAMTREVSDGIDIWFYVFRHSDKQIIDAYDNCPTPAPLTSTTATSEVYMLQTAIDLLRSELWDDSINDGAMIRDEGSVYDPGDGLTIRRSLLSDLLNRMDKLIKSLQLSGITGVLLD